MAEKAAEKHLSAVGGQTLRTTETIFLIDARSGVSATSTASGAMWRLHVESARFIDWPLRNIKTMHVIEWLDALQVKRPTSPNGQGLKAETIRRKRAKNVLGLLRRALQEAVRRGLVSSNPARELLVRPERRAETRGRFSIPKSRCACST